MSTGSARGVHVERQAVPEMVLLRMISGVIDVEMIIRGLKGNDEQCSTQRNCSDPWHRQILPDPVAQGNWWKAATKLFPTDRSGTRTYLRARRQRGSCGCAPAVRLGAGHVRHFRSLRARGTGETLQETLEEDRVR